MAAKKKTTGKKKAASSKLSKSSKTSKSSKFAKAPAKKVVKKTAAGSARSKTPALKSGSLRKKVSPTSARKFPRNFFWGTATSATQIDGGDAANDWIRFAEQPGRIADGSSPLRACDHWNRFESDFRLMKRLGMTAYRLGVDWSRFQPAPDEFDMKAVEHTRAMLSSLRAKGIRPLLTLNHFTLPAWWAERGGWENEENPADFLRFVEKLIPEIGDLVSDYITFNEPNVYAVQGYVAGVWPPGRKGLTGYLKYNRVLRHMLMTHFRVYDFIHNEHARLNFSAPRVSIAKHCRVFDPLNPESRLDADRARFADHRFNYLFTDCLQSGELEAPLGRNEKIHDGRAWEFYGLNYYTRSLIKFDWAAPGSLFLREVPPREAREDAPVNDLGWEIYPEGLGRLVTDLYHRYGLPIRVTENGIPTNDDEKRIDFLRAHLAALHEAMTSGVPVEGYYHWSFLDNFEWAEGYEPRFGLVGVNYDTQERNPGKAAREYGKIIRLGGL